MPRIRSLKPEIASDAKLAKVSRDARYTFVLLITQADDLGLVAASHRQLLGTLYPLDDAVTVPMLLGWIEELVSINLVKWLATRDGSPVLQLVNWDKHQRIDNAGRSQLGALLAKSPADPASGDSRNLAESRGESPLGPPTKDLGSTITDLRPLTTDQLVSVAIKFAVAANAGLAEHPQRPQGVPRIISTAARTTEATSSILAAGVPIAFAESALYTLGKGHSSERPIMTLKYFVAAVIRLWEQEGERAAVASSTRPPTLTTNRGNITTDQAIAAFEEWGKKSA